MSRYSLLTPKRPDAECWPGDVVKDTFNALATATGAVLPYPETCLVTEIGRVESASFRFNTSAVGDDQPLDSPRRWQMFLHQRLSVGAQIVDDRGLFISAADFFDLAGFAALPGHGGST